MRRWLLAALSALACLGALDLAIRVFDLFPEARSRLDAADPGARSAADERVSFKQLHPYLGWRVRPDADNDPPRNLQGYASAVSDYRTVSADDFVVGVFGGSVAAGIATVGADALAGTLTAARPDLAGRVKVLNFGSGAYKQPQQLYALTQAVLLGVPLDFVVNVDGLNEVALGTLDARRGQHPIFPSRPQLRGLLELSRPSASPEFIETSAAILRARSRIEGVRAWFAAHRWLGSSAVVRAIGGTLVGRAQERAAALETQQAALATDEYALIATLSDPCLAEPDACTALIAEIWREASALMRSTAETAGAGYLHALQPNQYVPGAKNFTVRERNRALDIDSHWDRSVKRGYPLLLAESVRLQAGGVAFLDLTGIYRGVDELIFTDPCCHTNRRGYEIMARAIGAGVAAAL